MQPGRPAGRCFNATHNAPYGPLREQSKWRSPAAIPRLNSVRWCALRRRESAFGSTVLKAPTGNTNRTSSVRPVTSTFAPDIVLLAVARKGICTWQSLARPRGRSAAGSQSMDRTLESATTLSRARIVSTTSPCLATSPRGIAARLPGSPLRDGPSGQHRPGAAGTAVSIVDCERLSALIGKQRWYDPRYWNLSKQAVALDALPLLAKTAARSSQQISAGRKCLVLDLDNTVGRCHCGGRPCRHQIGAWSRRAKVRGLSGIPAAAQA